MERRNFDTILGHKISNEAKVLIHEAQQAYLSKKLLIHPYELAEEESGKKAKCDASAVSMPEINDYIAIWIRKDLKTDEFNAVLPEELVHHLQAKEGFQEIYIIRPLKWPYLYNRRAIKEGFTDPLTSVVFDIASRKVLLEKGVNTMPLLESDFKNAKQAIEKAIGSAIKLEKLRRGEGRISNFPNYLLWWFDLFKLGLDPYPTRWKKDLYPGFQSIINQSVLNEWDNLTNYVDKFEIITKNESSLIMEEVCKQLMDAKPGFRQKRIYGRNLVALKMKELVPP